MFKVGDWVYGLYECRKKKHLIHSMIIGDITDYYICIESMNAKDRGKNAKEFMDSLYHAYTECGEIEGFAMVKKENTLATEQEAMEVLEAME